MFSQVRRARAASPSASRSIPATLFLIGLAFSPMAMQPAAADSDTGSQSLTITLPASGTDSSTPGGPANPERPEVSKKVLPPPDFTHLGVIAIGTVSSDGAQIVRRSRDGATGVQVLYTCARDQNVGVVGQLGEWYCVLMADQTVGCILADRLTITWERPAGQPDSGAPHDSPGIPRSPGFGGRVIDAAMSYLGVRYRWGGNTEAGIDCSGLVKAVFHQQGIDLPRTAREQSQVGFPVPYAEAQPGDRLSFCCHGSSVDHTGIYVGNGQFIHACGSRGQVCVSALEGSYLRWLVGIHRDIR